MRTLLPGRKIPTHRRPPRRPDDDRPASGLETAARYLLAHPTLLLTAAYAVVVVTFLHYEKAYFANFGLNIVEFYEPIDFLLAPFKRPLLTAAIVAGVVVAVWAATMDEMARDLERSRAFRRVILWIGPRRLAGSVVFLALATFVAFLSVGPHIDAWATVSGRVASTRVHMAGGTGPPLALIAVGTTKSVFIGVERTGDATAPVWLDTVDLPALGFRTSVIPMAGIERLEIAEARSGAALGLVERIARATASLLDRLWERPGR